MRIPFTAPRLPELEALPIEQRTLLLRRYARSAEARRFVRIVQASTVVAIVLFFVAQGLRGAVRALCFVAAALSLAGGVIFYRTAAAQAIRVILDSKDQDIDDDSHTPTA